MSEQERPQPLPGPGAIGWTLAFFVFMAATLVSLGLGWEAFAQGNATQAIVLAVTTIVASLAALGSLGMARWHKRRAG